MYKRRIFTRRNQARSFRLPIGLLLAYLPLPYVFLSSNVNISSLSVTDSSLPTALAAPHASASADEGTYWAADLHLQPGLFQSTLSDQRRWDRLPAAQ
jgi:hypothetical protein